LENFCQIRRKFFKKKLEKFSKKFPKLQQNPMFECFEIKKIRPYEDPKRGGLTAGQPPGARKLTIGQIDRRSKLTIGQDRLTIGQLDQRSKLTIGQDRLTIGQLDQRSRSTIGQDRLTVGQLDQRSRSTSGQNRLTSGQDRPAVKIQLGTNIERQRSCQKFISSVCSCSRSADRDRLPNTTIATAAPRRPL